MAEPRYSFVIPIYNEVETLPELHARVAAVMDGLDGESEALLVDDGSRDGSWELMVQLHERDPRFKPIRLARNFGHQLAITAGLDFALGEAVIVMDGDLQDPPEVVPDLVARWREGYEVVYAVREQRAGDPWHKRVIARVFYRLLRRLTKMDIPVDVGDFRLVDRSALEAFRTLRERNRYIRGMFSWVGFRQAGVTYARPERFAGETKYPFRRSLRLGIDGIVSFSEVPLRIALTTGFFISAVSFGLGVFAAVAKLAGFYTAPGWASILVVISFLGGVQLVVIGMMGLYVGRIYDEVKARPLYIVREAHGLAGPAAPTLTERGYAFRR